MARFPVNSGDVTRALIEEFAVKGGPRFELTSEIVPVVQVADVQTKEDTRKAWGETPSFVTGAPAGGINLFNPVDSGVIVTALGFNMHASASADVTIHFPLTGRETVLDPAGSFTDTRLAGEPAALISHALTTVVVANQVWTFRFENGAASANGLNALYNPFPEPLVLEEGTAVELIYQNNPATIRGGFVWTEQPSRPERLI